MVATSSSPLFDALPHAGAPLEVNALRRLAEPLLQLLVGRGLVVRFRGTSVDTQFDAEGRPAEITLPLLPDSVDEAVLEVFQGHIDRAAARALFTRRTEATNRLTYDPVAARIFLALEDARTERLMQKRFPGSAYNLERYYERLFAGAVGTEREEADFACAVRAAVGDALFETFAEAQFDERRSTVVDADDDVRPEEEGFDPAALRTHLCRAYAQSFEGETLTEAFDGLNSTEDAARLAAVLAGFLTENDAESDSETECESDGESGASGDSEAESQTEEEEGTGSGDGSTEEAGEGTEDSQAQAEENSDEEDSDEDADEASDGASGNRSESDDEDERADPEEADNKEDGEDDGAGDESSGSGEPEAGEEDEEGETEGEGSAAEALSNAARALHGRRGSASVLDFGSDIDSDSGIDADDAHERDDSSDSDDRNKSDNSDAAPLPGATEVLRSFGAMDATDDVFERIAARLLPRVAEAALARAVYRVYSTDDDRAELVRVRGDAPVAQIEELTASMTGTIQKNLERAFAARKLSHVTPGRRSGKLRASALYRLASGDVRVFEKREPALVTHAAVSLLIDCSGSMAGAPMRLAAVSAYALSTVLARLGVPFEVAGFTTLKIASAPLDWERWSRFEPLYMPLFKRFEDRWDAPARERLASLLTFPVSRMRNNIDGECVERAAARLALRPEGRRILIVLSDGEPAAEGWLADQEAHLAAVTASLSRRGIDAIGLGIMSEAVERFYPKHVVIHRLEDLPGTVVRELHALILGR